MYAISRSEKRKMSAVSGIQKEVNRSADHPVKLPGSDIDWTKTPDNEYFVHATSLRRAIRSVLADHGITSFRKDAVVMVDSFFGFSPEFQEKTDPETIRSYFQDCIKFAGDHLGVVINARSHVDEKTFHLHVQTVPIVENADGSFSLSAKRLMGNRDDYCNRQDLFFIEVGQRYGFDRCVKNEDRIEKREHLDNLEYKLSMREKELEKVTNDLETKTDLLETKTAELEEVTQELKLKTGVLEKAYDLIHSACNTIFKHVDMIYKGFVSRIENFLEKIADRAVLTDHDFDDAGIQKEDVKVTDDYNNRLVIPSLSSGERLSWSGVSPIYEQVESEYYPYGAVDNASGSVTTANLFDWSASFPVEDVDDFTDPSEVEFMYSVDHLEEVENMIAIVIGEKTDVEKSEEEIDHTESPTPSDQDDDQDKLDDFSAD